MSAPEILSLRWNNHRTHFLKLLSAIHNKSQYEDATVACSGKLFSVHRLVLSCCSNYFEQMFAQTQGKHSIIVLKDISAEVFESLLSYMYIGEAEVKKDLLSELLVAAHALEIKGLAISDEEDLPRKPNATSSVSKENTILKAADEFPPKKRPIEEYQQYQPEYSSKIQKLEDHTLSSSNSHNRSMLIKSSPNNDSASSTGWQSQHSTWGPTTSSSEMEHCNEESESLNTDDDQDGLMAIKQEMYEQQHNRDEFSFMPPSGQEREGSNNVQPSQASDFHHLVNMSQVTPAALMVSCSRAIPSNRLRDPSVYLPPDWNPSEQIPLFPDNSNDQSHKISFNGVLDPDSLECMSVDLSVTLEMYLMRSRLGSVLIEAYHEKRDFTTNDRSKLVALIIDGLLERFDSLRNCHLEKIAEDLMLVFPTELKETYYIGPCPEEGKRMSRGKLVDRYRNQIRWRKKKLAAGISLNNTSMTP